MDDEKYLAAYTAACALEILIEHLEAGTLRQPQIENAKQALRELAKLEREGEFFTRFEAPRRSH